MAKVKVKVETLQGAAVKDILLALGWFISYYILRAMAIHYTIDSLQASQPITETTSKAAPLFFRIFTLVPVVFLIFLIKRVMKSYLYPTYVKVLALIIPFIALFFNIIIVLLWLL